MNKILKKIVNFLSPVFYFLFVTFPNWVDDKVFQFLNRKIEIKIKNCFYLVNPNSGKKLGHKIISILKGKDPSAVIIDIIKENYVEKVKKHLIDNKGTLNIVICGGDGTFSRISDDLRHNITDIKRVVFIPMPIGTGNDLSRSLNLGGKMNVNYIYRFFNRINALNSKVVSLDTWKFKIKALDGVGNLKANFQIGLYLYFGIGYDAEVVYRFERMRKKVPYLLISNVV